MNWVEIVVFILLCIPLVGGLILLAVYGPGGGTWIKEDGTIIEWDDDGGGRILHPDGRLEEFPRDELD